MKTQKELMDHIYRYQRHIYDLSRRTFLFGRDRMLDQIDLEGDEKVLEIGCGTARNLIRLARKQPSLELYGIDASKEMLKTARKKARDYPIKLFYTLAEEFDYDRYAEFDVVIFSYSLSMIPEWKRVLGDALENLKQGGRLYIIDFWDQKGMPSWFGAVLRKWLSVFHVRFEPKLVRYLEQLSFNGEINLELMPVCSRYAYIAAVEKRSERPSVGRKTKPST
jgi:S-adenosylmethionine-diacylgycerolhomoserine-N-methlytransferase